MSCSNKRASLQQSSHFYLTVLVQYQMKTGVLGNEQFILLTRVSSSCMGLLKTALRLCGFKVSICKVMSFF